LGATLIGDRVNKQEVFRHLTKDTDPGLRPDDAGNYIVATTTNVIQAPAGIQRLCLISD
jgi:hypothetical protein